MSSHPPCIPRSVPARHGRGLSFLLAGALATLLACFMPAAGAQGVQAAPFDPNQSGLSGSWANAATDGQGFVLDVVADFFGTGRALIFGGWFTYDTALPGHLRWYTVQGELARDGVSAMAIYRTLGGSLDSAQPTTTEPVGEFRIRFTDCTHAAASYRFDDGRAGDIPLARLLGNPTCTSAAAAAAPAPGSSAWSGAWADTGNSGQGLVLEFDPTQELMFGAWYTFADAADPAAGTAGLDWYTLQAGAPRDTATFQDIGIYATSGGSFDRAAVTATVRVGTIGLVIHDCSHATLSYAFTAGPNAGRHGTLELTRLTPSREDCAVPPPHAGNAEGYWKASTATGDVRIIIPGNGEVYVVYQGNGVDARLVRGTLLDEAGRLSSDDAYSFKVTSVPGEWPERLVAITMEGTYAPREWLRLRLRGGAGIQTLDATWDPAYDMPASAAVAAGTYQGISGIDNGGLAIQFSIGADGSFTGANLMCSLSGTLVPRGTSNVFDWQLRGHSPGCIFGAGPLDGIAWYEPANRSFHSYVAWQGRKNVQYVNGFRQ
ncbi:MAG: hypothetical protein J0H15_03525 [Xanthomonadales bacterium]|nr:hypothetical protein [Xanthomonadales bacterium]